jgi:hypothetical protein
MLDSAIVRDSLNLYNKAARFKDSPIIETQLFTAQNSRDFGIAYLALLISKNKVSIETNFKSHIALKGIALVEGLLREAKKLSAMRSFKGTVFSMTGGGGSTDPNIDEKVFWNLTTKTNDDGSVGLIPSDKARSDARIWKEKHGLTYGGIKRVTKRETCRTFDTRLPLHWR